jgi:hypothetical protein
VKPPIAVRARNLALIAFKHSANRTAALAFVTRTLEDDAVEKAVAANQAQRAVMAVYGTGLADVPADVHSTVAVVSGAA